MGNCLASSNYISPAPSIVLPDPLGPSSFKLSPNSSMSSNYNVYMSSSSEEAPLWLFLRSKGVSNGRSDSYLVLENFWRPPFSNEGEVLCWCHIPAFQTNGAYRNTGVEQYGVSEDLHSEVYWSNTAFPQDKSSASMLLWTRREWSFSTRVGFYRDRYMEEPLGVLEVSSKGWTNHKKSGSNPSRCFNLPSKEISEVHYVFRDKEGTRYSIELDMSRGKDSLRVVSLDSRLFTCTVTPSRGWIKDNATVVVTTRSAVEASLGLLLGFACANTMSPQNIVANLRISQLKKHC